MCNFEFGLRKKFGNLVFPFRNLVFSRGGGVICNFEFGLRKKFGNLGGGVICNFEFGLRKNLEIWSFQGVGGGGNLQLRIWT